MERLRQHFLQAKTCTNESRQVGLEIETLMIDKTRKMPATWPGNPDPRRWPEERCMPIKREQSQEIMRRVLADPRFWLWGKVTQEVFENTKGATIVKVANGLYDLFYELGWNNFELISRSPYLVSDSARMFSDFREMLERLYAAAGEIDCAALPASCDGFENENTLMMPDERDEAWKDLDGPVLCVLGHIASVHYNIELMSLDEGMRWIEKIRTLRERQGWPSADASCIWTRYLAESRAGYEADRFGMTPTANFDEYCRKLSTYKIVMNRVNGAPQRIADPRSFEKTPDIDVELFLRSVWWGARLRVRGDQLVLEIRDVPRGTDSEIRENFEILRRELGF